MAIPGPGTAISMNTIAAEFGGTVPHSLSEYYRGGGLVPNAPANAAIPTSGQIAIGDFYGAVNRVAINLVISGNAYNYDVYDNRGPTYAPGSSDITVTVNPGVTVGSTSVPAYAMLVPSSFGPGDTVTIINNGTIQGMGGTGGTGGAVVNVPGTGALTPGNPGGGGGNAIYVNRPTVITNNGTVASGGGGGGGGGAGSVQQPAKVPYRSGGGGGGGGAGFNGGVAGAGGPAYSGAPSNFRSGTPGSAGTSPAGGAGAPRYFFPVNPSLGSAGPGGAGGGRGAAGSAGGASITGGNPSRPGGPGGAAGNYIVGNPFVTWPATGTRQGGVA